MEMHQIRYFLAVAETLNFTRAAERCNVSQPAMTRELAFGPYLAAAAVFYLFAEPWIEIHFRLSGM